MWKNNSTAPTTISGAIQQNRVHLVMNTGYLKNSAPTILINSSTQTYCNHGNKMDQDNPTVDPAASQRECMDYAHLGCRHLVPHKDPGMPVSRKVGGSTTSTAAAYNNTPQNLPGLGNSIAGHSKRVIIKNRDVNDTVESEPPPNVDEHKMVCLDQDRKEQDDDEYCSMSSLDVLAQAAMLISELEKKKSDDWKEGLPPPRASQKVRKRQFQYDQQAPDSVKKPKVVPKRKTDRTKDSNKVRDLSKEVHGEQVQQTDQQLITKSRQDYPAEEEVNGALIISKRGRNQKLPPKFQDSVIGKWRN